MIHLLIPAAVLFLTALILSGAAGSFSRRRLRAARTVRVPSESTGAEMAMRILARGQASKVLVVEFEGYPTDRYDPANRRLLLSRRNFRGRSAAAWAVAIHEAGHALQHRDGGGGYKARMAAIHACRYLAGSVLVVCGVAGLARALPFKAGGLIVGTVWSACFLANLITLPAEFDASRRALRLLGESDSCNASVESAMTAIACRDLDALLTTLPALVYSLLPLSRKKPESAKPARDSDTT